MSKVTMILVGGFLGAGKTTLIGRAARQLSQRGKRVGLVANDQAAELVDTEVLRQQGFDVEEVAGGCFCCRFGEMIGACERLLEAKRPDVLIAEPVGSCTDLSATVLQPLKAFYGERLRLAPFSVLLDPARARLLAQEHSSGEFAATVSYILRKQVEEADLIVLAKADLLSSSETVELKAALETEFPGRRVLAVSAVSGQGMDEWIAAMLGGATAGATIAEVDYPTYAAGEAALGWLNASASLHADGAVDWRAFCQGLLETIRQGCQRSGAAIAHVKILLTTAGGSVAGNLTSVAGPASLRGECAPGQAEALLAINARVESSPGALEALVTRSLVEVSGTTVAPHMKRLVAFSPGEPKPVLRFIKPVTA